MWPTGNDHDGGPFLPGWPVELDGAIQDTLPLIGPGQDPAIAKIGGQPVIVASTTGSATIEEFDAAGDQIRAVQQGSLRSGLRRDRPKRHDQPLRVGRRSAS